MMVMGMMMTMICRPDLFADVADAALAFCEVGLEDLGLFREDDATAIRTAEELNRAMLGVCDAGRGIFIQAGGCTVLHGGCQFGLVRIEIAASCLCDRLDLCRERCRRGGETGLQCRQAVDIGECLDTHGTGRRLHEGVDIRDQHLLWDQDQFFVDRIRVVAVFWPMPAWR